MALEKILTILLRERRIGALVHNELSIGRKLMVKYTLYKLSYFRCVIHMKLWGQLAPIMLHYGCKRYLGKSGREGKVPTNEEDGTELILGDTT